MNTDTQDFLSTLLWANESHEEHDAERGEGNGFSLGGDATIYKFSPAFVAAVDKFISSFRDYLTEKDFDLDRLQWLESSFGGNCYLSLSGAGAGFFDNFGPSEGSLGCELQAHLEAFSGGRHRFEELDLCLGWKDDNTEIDLAFIPSAIEEYRAKYFVTPWMDALQADGLRARLEACRWDLSTLSPAERAALIKHGELCPHGCNGKGFIPSAEIPGKVILPTPCPIHHRHK